ncbi:MAG: rhodanese-like domain-containing protein [Candidatus Eremiobacteraeota bacterium]|nr:rhodanese-like domain-containing protein [Candidatus Eremiobacteraeota bacterium]
MLKEMDAVELGRRHSGDEKLVVLDVREPDEWVTSSIAGTLQIPMREVPQRLHEIPKDAAIAVMCHHGGRSERVANFLLSQGYSDVTNVCGGIDAYSRDVDPDVPRY